VWILFGFHEKFEFCIWCVLWILPDLSYIFPLSIAAGSWFCFKISSAPCLVWVLYSPLFVQFHRHWKLFFLLRSLPICVWFAQADFWNFHFSLSKPSHSRAVCAKLVRVARVLVFCSATQIGFAKPSFAATRWWVLSLSRLRQASSSVDSPTRFPALSFILAPTVDFTTGFVLSAWLISVAAAPTLSVGFSLPQLRLARLQFLCFDGRASCPEPKHFRSSHGSSISALALIGA
jgi:hypothetical protein